MGDAYDYATLLRRLPYVARPILQRHRLEHWTEDVCQEAALTAWQLHCSGRRVGHRATRLCILGAIGRMFRDSVRANGPRYRLESHGELTDASIVSPRGIEPGMRAIALWRLQELWPTLTDTQRDGVLRTVSGDSISSTASSGRRQVRAHVNTPRWALSKVGRHKTPRLKAAA